MADEKESIERSSDSKQNQTNDPFKGIFWGALFIYTGILFFLVEWNFLYSDEWFPFFIFGLGILMIGDFLIRQLVESLPKSGMSKLIFGLIFLVLSASNIFYLEDWWPIILVFIGGFMVWSAFRKREIKLS